MSPYISPSLVNGAYNCPRCGAYAKQNKYLLKYAGATGDGLVIKNGNYTICSHCSFGQIWLNADLVYPDFGNAPHPNDDLPEDVQADYNEAKSILSRSPRGAAALLRLAIQKLCKHLGEPGKNINSDIASLVKKGLPVRIQKALDILRVIGNEAVHPGSIDISDNKEVAQKLFNLVNLIADVMITQPKEVDALFDALPEDKREGIAQRDSSH